MAPPRTAHPPAVRPAPHGPCAPRPSVRVAAAPRPRAPRRTARPPREACGSLTPRLPWRCCWSPPGLAGRCPVCLRSRAPGRRRRSARSRAAWGPRSPTRAPCRTSRGWRAAGRRRAALARAAPRPTAGRGRPWLPRSCPRWAPWPAACPPWPRPTACRPRGRARAGAALGLGPRRRLAGGARGGGAAGQRRGRVRRPRAALPAAELGLLERLFAGGSPHGSSSAVLASGARLQAAPSTGTGTGGTSRPSPAAGSSGVALLSGAPTSREDEAGGGVARFSRPSWRSQWMQGSTPGGGAALLATPGLLAGSEWAPQPAAASPAASGAPSSAVDATAVTPTTPMDTVRQEGGGGSGGGGRGLSLGGGATVRLSHPHATARSRCQRGAPAARVVGADASRRPLFLPARQSIHVQLVLGRDVVLLGPVIGSGAFATVMEGLLLPGPAQPHRSPGAASCAALSAASGSTGRSEGLLATAPRRAARPHSPRRGGGPRSSRPARGGPHSTVRLQPCERLRMGWVARDVFMCVCVWCVRGCQGGGQDAPRPDQRHGAARGGRAGQGGGGAGPLPPRARGAAGRGKGGRDLHLALARARMCTACAVGSDAHSVPSHSPPPLPRQVRLLGGNLAPPEAFLVEELMAVRGRAERAGAGKGRRVRAAQRRGDAPGSRPPQTSLDKLIHAGSPRSPPLERVRPGLCRRRALCSGCAAHAPAPLPRGAAAGALPAQPCPAPSPLAGAAHRPRRGPGPGVPGGSKPGGEGGLAGPLRGAGGCRSGRGCVQHAVSELLRGPHRPLPRPPARSTLL